MSDEEKNIENLPAETPDDSQNKSKVKNNKMLIIVVALVVIMGAGAIWAVNYINEIKSQSGIKVEPNVFFNEEEADEHLDKMVSSINVTMYSSTVCRRDSNGNLVAGVGIENKNDFQYMVKFDLMDTGETIAETGLIAPGQTLEDITLSKDLPKGNHSVNVIFTAISDEDNQTALGSTGVNVNFAVTD